MNFHPPTEGRYHALTTFYCQLPTGNWLLTTAFLKLFSHLLRFKS